MLKTSLSTVLLAAIALTLTVAPLFAADRMVPGMWEFTSTANGDTHTFKHCATPEETASVNGDAKSARANAAKRSEGHCTITDFNINGNTVTYAMICGKTSVRSTTTYSGTTFEANLKTRTEGAAEVTTRVTAKRLGVCPLTITK